MNPLELSALVDVQQWLWAAEDMLAEHGSLFEEAQARRSDPGRAMEVDYRLHSARVTRTHFVLVALTHLDRALRQPHVTAEIRELAFDSDLSKMILDARNIHEHWAEQRDDFMDHDRPKRKSGKSYAERFPNAMPWSSSWSHLDGHVIAGVVPLERVREQLARIADRLTPRLDALRRQGTAG
jgi:hypothetical protein